ncbi:MAG TPA: MoaD/ThiS family protein [Syntrophorhabdaceae bacterium]|nr:MoaD/ThiS family protein [Syntrophorhabdaceae bacterium]
MVVNVKLFATLRKDRFSEKIYEIHEGTTVGELIKELELPHEQISIIFVNGRHAKLETVLNDKDEVALFPPIGGG